MKPWIKIIVSISLFCTCLFTCLGYASFSDALNVNGKMENDPPQAVFITSVTPTATLGGKAEVNRFMLTTLSSLVTLGDNESSTVTLHVTVLNNTPDYYRFNSVEHLTDESAYSNADIVFETSVDYRGEARLLPGRYAEIDITFQYDRYPISSRELSSVLNLHFHLVGEQEDAAVDYDEYVERFLSNGRYGLNDNSNQAKSIIAAIKQYRLVYAKDNLQGTNLKNLVSAVNTNATEDLTFVYEYVNDTTLVLYTYEEMYNSADYKDQTVPVYKTTFTYGTNSQGVTQWNPSAFERGQATLKNLKTPKGATLYAINPETWRKA